MDENLKNIIEGRKTFFIAPDVSLLPESYLEDYLSRGYETYIIMDDRYCPLDKKIEIILSVFKDVIIFFYVDSVVQGIDWPVFIKEMRQKYGDDVLFGVMYAKRAAEDEKRELEQYYLFNVGLQCGCIPLEYQKAKNFELIDKVMYANQACGRRKNVRAICDESCKVSFTCNKISYRGKICDVSLSHFSFVLPHQQFEAQMYEKIDDAFLEVQGMHFHTSCLYCMQRELSNEMLYIFVFLRKDGSQGVEQEILNNLQPKLYQMITDKGKELMRGMFESMGKRMRMLSK